MNLTEDLDVHYVQEPVRFYFTMILTLTICMLGLFANLLCAIVLFQRSMKSSYTYILIGLTFSDILLLLVSSVRTYGNLADWNLSTTHGLAVFIFLWDWIGTGGTKYFTVAVSLERCFAICCPIHAHRWVTIENSKLFALSVEGFVILLAAFSYVYKFHLYSENDAFDIYAAVVLHFSPLLAVVALNVLIYFGLKRFRQKRQSLTEKEASEEVSVTNMLLTVVLVFGFCYSFEFIRRILTYAGYFDLKKFAYYDYLINHFSDIFYVLNSSVNFIIYCLLGRKFRTEFLKIFFKIYCCKDYKSNGNGMKGSKASHNTTCSKESSLDSI